MRELTIRRRHIPPDYVYDTRLAAPHDTGWREAPAGELRRRVTRRVDRAQFIARCSVRKVGGRWAWETWCPLGVKFSSGSTADREDATLDAWSAVERAWKAFREGWT